MEPRLYDCDSSDRLRLNSITLSRSQTWSQTWSLPTWLSTSSCGSATSLRLF